MMMSLREFEKRLQDLIVFKSYKDEVTVNDDGTISNITSAELEVAKVNFQLYGNDIHKYICIYYFPDHIKIIKEVVLYLPEKARTPETILNFIKEYYSNRENLKEMFDIESKDTKGVYTINIQEKEDAVKVEYWLRGVEGVPDLLAKSITYYKERDVETGQYEKWVS